MEDISQLVSDSLARHGMEPSLDHLRLEWSRWFRCESSFSVLLVPAKPGIFALGEEMVPAASAICDPAREGRPSLAQRFSAGEARKTIAVPEGRPNSAAAGKRMLAVFQISETDDLGMALGRLFLPGNPVLAKLNSGRCFTRYTVIEDAAQRCAACAVFQRWMQDSTETASGIQQQPCGADTLVRESGHQESCGSDFRVRVESESKSARDSDVDKIVPPSISSAWGVGFMEVQNREARAIVRRPAPLPSGF